MKQTSFITQIDPVWIVFRRHWKNCNHRICAACFEQLYAAIDFLGTSERAAWLQKADGVVGFSMGAAWSLLLSTLKPETVGAVVVFYGSYPIDFSKASASFLGHFSPDDEWEPIGDVRATEEKIRGAGREVAFHFYPGTKHWFVEENRPVEYNREASNLAWKRTLEFIDSKL